MNKRMRKKHAKQAWMRLQKEIRDPAFWIPGDMLICQGRGYRYARTIPSNIYGAIVASHQEGDVRVVDDVKVWAISIGRDVGYRDSS